MPPEAQSRMRCWCGNADLAPFSDDYRRCPRCQTLVSAGAARDSGGAFSHLGPEFYDLDYFVAGAAARGHPDIAARSRLDLSERCVHWLKTLLRFRPPPARTLEVGCAHGSFVATLAAAGYLARGLDLAPAVTDFARQAFDVPMLTGTLESQQLPRASVDVVVLMDVLEHLADPAATIAAAVHALADDGLLFIQTPRFAPGRSWPELRAADAPFLSVLLKEQHLFLLSEDAMRALLARIGVDHVVFAPPLFVEQDMVVLASRRPIVEHVEQAWREALRATPRGRLMEGTIDAYDRCEAVKRELDAVNADRAQRLDVIHRQQRDLEVVNADRARRLDDVTRLQRELAAVGADRAEQLEIRLRLEREIETVNADRAARLAAIARLEHELAAVNDDRARRLDVIERQQQESEALAARLARQSELADARATEIAALRERLETLDAERRAPIRPTSLLRVLFGPRSPRPRR